MAGAQEPGDCGDGDDGDHRAAFGAVVGSGEPGGARFSRGEQAGGEGDAAYRERNEDCHGEIPRPVQSDLHPHGARADVGEAEKESREDGVECGE